MAIDLASLSLTDIAKAVAENRLPPVASWNPAHCGDSEMRIAADGTWFHQGSPIGRAAMVKLFASILRREADGSYVLVTPAEKLDIIVEDAPFIAVELRSEGMGQARSLAFRLNTDDLVIAGPDHPIRFAEVDGAPRPYVMVRAGMEALITRNVYYELVNLALDEGADPPGLWSDGAFFVVAPA
ncbi:MAG: DUF1285 domain-containing protein [Sphingomonadaceae bacterium]